MHIFLIFCVLVVHFALFAWGTLSGLYVDNGLDQTIIQRYLSKQEKKEVEHEILNLLGLPDRPRSKRYQNFNSLDSSGSKFMFDVYKSLLDSPSDMQEDEFNLSGNDLTAIEESDAIVSFKSHNGHMPALRHRKGRWLWFDVSEVSPDATIVNAELRLYQSSNSTMGPQTFTLSLYHLLDDKGDSELEHVGGVNITSDEEGWKWLNVTSSLADWIMRPGSNHGLYIDTHLISGGAEVRPEDLGLVISDVGETQPFLVGFLQGSSEVGSAGTTRVPRVRRQARRRKNTSSYPSNPLTDWTQSQRSCQIQTLYVSFKDLNWQDWIIAPDGYGAFYCSGECNFPLNAHMNATNHAIVQTLVHLMNPLQVPKPCCAPTRLTPISVLYYLEDSNVILKKYKNMVVKSCGCH